MNQPTFKQFVTTYNKLLTTFVQHQINTQAAFPLLTNSNYDHHQN